MEQNDFMRRRRALCTTLFGAVCIKVLLFKGSALMGNRQEESPETVVGGWRVPVLCML